MVGMVDDAELELGQLDLTQLALFVGMAANDWVLAELARAGHQALRNSHGYLVQHLIGGPRSVGELAGLLSITQQAVSKQLAELAQSGYIENVASDDARVRRVTLSKRGQALLAASRAARKKLQARLRRALGDAALVETQRQLSNALQLLGGAEAVKKRRVKPPG